MTPQVVMLDPQISTHGMGHPFIYDTATNVIYVGGPGGYHHAIYRDIYKRDPSVSQHRTIEGRADPDNVTFYSQVSYEEKSPIKEALREAELTEAEGSFDWGEDGFGQPEDLRFGSFEDDGTPWDPGTPGKGLIWDGEAFTWNTHGPHEPAPSGPGTYVDYNGPHHHEMFQQLWEESGNDPYDMPGVDEGGNITPLNINADGGYSMAGWVGDLTMTQEEHEAMQLHHPSLHYDHPEEDDEFHFGAHQMQLLTPSTLPGIYHGDPDRTYEDPRYYPEEKPPVEIVDTMKYDPRSEPGAFGSWEEYDRYRKPWIYNSEDNKVYMGAHGVLHADTARFYDIPYYNTGALTSDVPHGDDGYTSSEGFYSQIPDEALRAVEKHFGIETQQAEDEFHFGAEEPERLAPIPQIEHEHEEPYNVFNQDVSWEDWAHAVKNNDPGQLKIERGMEDREALQDYNFYSLTRKPWLYHAPSNTVYMGAHGALHKDVAEHYQIPYKGTGGLMASSMDDPSDYTGAVSYDVNQIPDWVAGKVEQAYGVGTGANPEEDWHFGTKYFAPSNLSNATEPKTPANPTIGYTVLKSESQNKTARGQYDELKWTPGQPGKGWTLADGSVWTWNVDAESRPFHMHKDYRIKKTGLPKADQPFQISREGEVMRLGKPIDPEFMALISEVDPRLKPADPEGDYGMRFT